MVQEGREEGLECAGRGDAEGNVLKRRIEQITSGGDGKKEV